MSGLDDLEAVFDDALALSSAAADSHVWCWMAGLHTTDRVTPAVKRWVAYTTVIVGGDRFVAVLEELIPYHEAGETSVVDFHELLRRLCAAYPPRHVAERRVKTWQGRYMHRMRSVCVALPPPPPAAGNVASFVAAMYRLRVQLLAELEERAA